MKIYDFISIYIMISISLYYFVYALIRAHLVYQMIHVQLVLLDGGSNQQNLKPITPYTRVAKKKLL